MLVRKVQLNPITTPKDFVMMLEETGTKISKSTVNRVLYHHNLKGRSARKKPLLQTHHKKARLWFATAHGDEYHNSFRNVLWSDETKTELFGHNDHRCCPQSTWTCCCSSFNCSACDYYYLTMLVIYEHLNILAMFCYNLHPAQPEEDWPPHISWFLSRFIPRFWPF